MNDLNCFKDIFKIHTQQNFIIIYLTGYCTWYSKIHLCPRRVCKDSPWCCQRTSIHPRNGRNHWCHYRKSYLPGESGVAICLNPHHTKMLCFFISLGTIVSHLGQTFGQSPQHVLKDTSNIFPPGYLRKLLSGYKFGLIDQSLHCVFAVWTKGS